MKPDFIWHALSVKPKSTVCSQEAANEVQEKAGDSDYISWQQQTAKSTWIWLPFVFDASTICCGIFRQELKYVKVKFSFTKAQQKYSWNNDIQVRSIEHTYKYMYVILCDYL